MLAYSNKTLARKVYQSASRKDRNKLKIDEIDTAISLFLQYLENEIVDLDENESFNVTNFLTWKKRVNVKKVRDLYSRDNPNEREMELTMIDVKLSDNFKKKIKKRINDETRGI